MSRTQEHFGEELDRLVDRFRQEYHATYADIVGVLHFKAFTICHEACEACEDEDDEEDEEDEEEYRHA